MASKFVFKSFREELKALLDKYQGKLPAGGIITFVDGYVDKKGAEVSLRYSNEQTISSGDTSDSDSE